MSDIEWMQSDYINELKARIKELEVENTCDVCRGKPSQEPPCMCNGTGKMSEAAKFLRVIVMRNQEMWARLDEPLANAEKLLKEYKNEIKKEKN